MRNRFFTLIVFFVGFILISSAQNVLFDRALYDLAKYKEKKGRAYFGAFANFYYSNSADLKMAFQVSELGLVFQSNLPFKSIIYFETEYFLDNNQLGINQLRIQKEIRKHHISLGIIAPEIGNYNINHILADQSFLIDPLSIKELTPNVYSDFGLSILRKLITKEGMHINYSISLLQGLNENIVFNNAGTVKLNEGKDNVQSFNTLGNIFKDNNNNMMLHMNVNFKEDSVFSFGLSLITGRYNNNYEDFPTKRFASLVLDFQVFLGKLNNKNELVYNFINIPNSVNELLAKRQTGFYSTFTYPIYEFKSPNNHIYLAYRFNFADLNVGFFESTNQKIGSEYFRHDFGIVYQLNRKLSFKANFFNQSSTDILDNLPIVQNTWNIGVSSWF